MSNQNLAAKVGGSIVSSEEYVLTVGQIKTLVSSGVIPQGTPEPNIRLFAQFCKEANLSPFKRQVYLLEFWTKNGNRYLNFTGIDGLRAIAMRSGVHAGTSDAMWDRYQSSPGVYAYYTSAELIKQKIRPTTCTIEVTKYMNGRDRVFPVTIVIDEFYPKTSKNPLAHSKLFQMAAKTAEKFALLRAFPEEMANIHIEEERDAIEGNTVTENTPPTQDLTPTVQFAKAEEVNGDTIREVSEERLLQIEEWQSKLEDCKTSEELANLWDKSFKGVEEMLSDKDLVNLVRLRKEVLAKKEKEAKNG